MTTLSDLIRDAIFEAIKLNEISSITEDDLNEKAEELHKETMITIRERIIGE